MMPFTPSSSSSMISPVEEVLGSPTVDISSENERLATGDHAKLLSELMLIRRLYEQSLCKVLDKSARKESFSNNTDSSLLKNRDMNRLSTTSIQDLQMVSTRENRDKSGPSMKFVHTPCFCNDLMSLIPSSESPMMAPACTELGREPLSLLNENNRLRRDNTILLSELTHARKLYNEALSIIKIQKNRLEEANHLQQHPSGLKIVDSQSRDMHGPLDNSSAAPSDEMQHKRDLTDSPSCNNDPYHDCKNLRGCQDAYELMPQAATIDITEGKNSSEQSESGEIKGSIRLFGVPLQCSKKRQYEEDLCSLNGIANTDTYDDDELMIIKVVMED